MLLTNTQFTWLIIVIVMLITVLIAFVGVVGFYAVRRHIDDPKVTMKLLDRFLGLVPWYRRGGDKDEPDS